MMYFYLNLVVAIFIIMILIGNSVDADKKNGEGWSKYKDEKFAFEKYKTREIYELNDIKSEIYSANEKLRSLQNSIEEAQEKYNEIRKSWYKF